MNDIAPLEHIFIPRRSERAGGKSPISYQRPSPVLTHNLLLSAPSSLPTTDDLHARVHIQQRRDVYVDAVVYVDSGRQYTRPGFSRSKKLNVPPMLSTHWQRVAPRSFSSSGPSPTEAGQLPTIASSRSCPFSSSTLEPVFLLEIRVQREDILVERLVRLDVYPVSLPCLSLLRGAKSVPYYS